MRSTPVGFGTRFRQFATVVTTKTKLGLVKGVERLGSVSYLGIPYAAAPLGPLRWQPPVELGSWDGLLDATQHPNRCYQLPFPQTLNPGEIPGSVSEDCLYLNIHTPAADDKKRPVLVYIHGGGYTVGSANDFDPSPFARKHDAVVVAINYRLGLFGFLDLSTFGSDYVGSASLGFQDQIAAIRWISEHIGAFGGDPDNITVCGVSAGAGSVLALMAAPSAKGLFQKAIGFSPGEIAREPPDLLASLADALGVNEDSVLELLQSFTGDELFKLQVDTGVTGSAAVDGTIILQPADDAIRQRINPVPLIIGTCINEGTMLTPSLDDYENIPDLSGIEASLTPTIGRGDPDRYASFLGRLMPHATPEERMNRLWYDYFRAPTLRTAQAASEVSVDAWVYSFEVPTDHPFGPTHASDMPFSFYLFEEVDDGSVIAFHPNNAANRRLAEIWSGTIANFMRTGDPNWARIPSWPKYETPSRSSMVLREELAAMNDIDGADARAAYGMG